MPQLPLIAADIIIARIRSPEMAIDVAGADGAGCERVILWVEEAGSDEPKNVQVWEAARDLPPASVKVIHFGSSLDSARLFTRTFPDAISAYATIHSQ